MELKLNDYNAYRSSMIGALLRYSYYKPAKLDRQSAEDVFQDGFFKLNELLKQKKFEFNDLRSKDSFIWRINKFTYLTMISTDKSKYKRGLPICSYIEDLLVETTDLQQEEDDPCEDRIENLKYLASSLLKNISNKNHRKYYKMYLKGSTMSEIAKKYNLNVKSLAQQINRINIHLEEKTGIKISKRHRINGK